MALPRGASFGRLAIALASRPGRAIVAYVLASSFWIVGSDALMARLASPPAPLELAGMLKGLLFVAATAWLFGELLRANCERLRLAAKILECSGEAVLITDPATRIVALNPRFCEITGYTAEEAIGRTPRLLQSGRQDRAFYVHMWRSIHEHGSWQGEIWNRRKNGEIYAEMLTVSTIRHANGSVLHYIGQFVDLTEHKSAERDIARLAHFDALTGLPNRVLVLDRLQQALTVAAREGHQVAVLFVDVDRFKYVNDTLGHVVGDALLQVVAERVHACLRAEDTFGRFGGDEFIVVLPNAGMEGSTHAAHRIREAMERPFQVEGKALTVSLSIGISIFPDNGSDFETLYKCADAAMHRAKQMGRRGIQFFTEEMQASMERVLLLESRLPRALQGGEIQLVYQPQIDLDTNRVVGAEALLRWHSPEHGTVSPAEFIPLAEDAGFILPLGEWALRTAVRQLKRWEAAGLPPLRLSVNLSAVQFRRQDLARLVPEVLGAAAIAPEQLELELTETVAMQEMESAVRVIEELAQLGVRFALDDFGTGYSSLSYLRQFRVSRLKIDRSFVTNAPHDADDGAIVVAIINLARSLGMEVIAEGVETAEQLDFLRANHCSQIQGFYFSRPLAADAFADFVRGRRPSPLSAGAREADDDGAAPEDRTEGANPGWTRAGAPV